MSVDYFLFSPSKNRCVMVGSIGMSGVKSWPADYGGGEFIAWAIENSIYDVVLVNEDQLPDDVENISKYRKIE
jgi:hypothetical protein